MNFLKSNRFINSVKKDNKLSEFKNSCNIIAGCYKVISIIKTNILLGRRGKFNK